MKKFILAVLVVLGPNQKKTRCDGLICHTQLKERTTVRTFECVIDREEGEAEPCENIYVQ